MPSVLDGVRHISDVDAQIVKQNEERNIGIVADYRDQVVNVFTEFFQAVSESLKDIDHNMAFYT